MSKISTKKLTNFFLYVFRIIRYSIVNFALNAVILLLYPWNLSDEWLISFFIIIAVSWIVTFILAFNSAKKDNKKRNAELLTKLIEIYDASKDDYDRFSKIESEILNTRVSAKKGDIRERQIKTAYLVKSLIESEISTAQLYSILGLINTVFFKIVDTIVENPYKIYIIGVSFFMLAMMFVDAYKHIPKQKFISSVCDKIIHEAKKTS